MVSQHSRSGTREARDAVLVTGAASGIGLELATGFATRGVGVFACDRHEELASRLGEAVGPRARVTTQTMDQGDPRDCELVSRRLESGGWALSAAVLCAGFTRFAGVMATTRRELDELVAANFAGTFEMLKIAAENMIANGTRGSIVVIGSINAEAPLPSQAVYSATKAAVASLAVSAAIELAEHGIRVNTVAPGAVLSGMNSSDEAEGIPLARVGVPRDIVGAVDYLVGEASSYVTASTITVDGGLLRAR